jgi:hypothetical protein
MSDKDLDDEDELSDLDVFDTESVQWKVLPSKRSSEVTIKFYDDDGGAFNLIKIWGSLHKLANELAREMDIMEESEGEH